MTWYFDCEFCAEVKTCPTEDPPECILCGHLLCEECTQPSGMCPVCHCLEMHFNPEFAAKWELKIGGR